MRRGRDGGRVGVKTVVPMCRLGWKKKKRRRRRRRRRRRKSNVDMNANVDVGMHEGVV